jgi:coenzyme F420-reducing hydrogenase delta subunit
LRHGHLVAQAQHQKDVGWLERHKIAALSIETSRQKVIALSAEDWQKFKEG